LGFLVFFNFKYKLREGYIKRCFFSKMEYYTYLLCCWKTKNGYNRHKPLYGDIIYCGYTYNIFQRLVEHIKGKSPYTSQFKGNIRFGYLEIHKTRKEAMNREDKIKKFGRDEKVVMIANFQILSPDILDFINNNLKKLLK